ncbi:MAG: Ig-like domain-containing protein, partial [bacterium]
YPAAGGYTLSFYAKVTSGTARVVWRLNAANGTPVEKIIDITALATGNVWTPFVIAANNSGITPRSLSFKTSSAGNFLIDDVKIFRNTDANGQLAVNWTVGDTAMTQVVHAEAKVGSITLAGSPAAFTATARAGAAKKLVAVSGNNQNGGQDQFLNAPLTVRVSDDYVNGIAGRNVTFTVRSGDAKLNGNVSSLNVTSDANGLARANLKLGPAAKDTIKVEASSTGLQSVIFKAIAAVPSQVTKVAGAPTSGSAGIRLSKPLIVKVADALGKPISGYPVQFTVTQGGGSFSGKTQATLLTDSTGQARVFPALGTTPGAPNRFQAVISYNGQTLPAQPIAFAVRAVGLKAMSTVSGGGQTGNTCEPLAQPFKIKIVDSLNIGVKGQTVKFSVTAGGGNFGGVNIKDVLTDSLGIAQVTLMLGDKAGANQTTARREPALSGSPQTFAATAQLGKAAVLRKVSGDSLTGAVNAVLSMPLAVRVTDKCAANGITAIPVTFIVKAGGGKVNGKDTVTVMSGSDGKAQVSWKLGLSAGLFNNRVEVKAAFNNTPLANSPAIFVASATAGGARAMNIRAGNRQNGRAGETLTNPLVVRVIDGPDGTGNPVPDHRVRFTITRGGGKFTTGSKDTTLNTDANGDAKIFWSLGGAVGTNAQEVRATATNSGGGNLINSPLVFTANVNGSDPSAEGSVFEVNSSVPVPADGETKCKVTVYVRDRFGNPVRGLAVTFFVSGGPNVIDQPAALTDSLGRAVCQFSSTRAEVKNVTAKIIGGIDLTRGATVTFIPTQARNISLVTGNGQACNVKAALPNPLKVKVGDRFSNGVPNHEVKFIVKGEGRILESGPIKTDGSGVASARFVAGASTGQIQIWAESPGLTNSPVIFVATVTQTPAQRMLEVSGTAQRGPVNQMLPEPLVVRVTDGFGRPVFGVPVKVQVTFGGGSVSSAGGSFSSDELGEVRARWRLGPAAGVNTLRFEIDGLAGSPIDFRADATSDVAAILTGTNCGSVSGPVGGTTPQPLTVRVTDVSGNGVDSVDVLFELLQGTGSFSSRDQIRVVQMTTANGGLASVPVTFGNESGYRRVRVSAEGLSGSPMICQVYGRALAAQTMEAIPRTNDQRGTKGKPLNFPLQVLVKDRLSNPVPNENLSFLITAGGGDFNGTTPFTARTDSNGIASATWVLGRFAAANEATVVRNGLLPSTLVFKATGFDNNFPVFAEAPDRRVTEGDVIEFQVKATDADGEALKYGAKNLPAGAQFDSLGTQVFRWATDPNSASRYEVSFFARDPRGGADEALVVIEVKNRNQQPIIFNRIPAGNSSPSLPDTTLEIINGVGTMLMRVNATDPDGDVLSYRWFINGKYAGSATNTFFFRSAERFNYVEALVFDQEDTAHTQWMIKVPVELSGLSAVLENGIAGAKQVSLRWSTASETNHAGFNVLRSQSSAGRYEKLNRQLIPPRHDGQYIFVDDNVEAGGRYFYKLQDVDLQGNVTEHGPVAINVAAPQSYVLQQNYPNPFNPTTQIGYELPKAGQVSLIIYNSLGQEVRRLVDKQQAAGYHHVTWNGRDQSGKPVPSGIYHYRLQVGDFVATKRMLMAK